MGVSRSGFYKWKNAAKAAANKSGNNWCARDSYRWVHAYIQANYGENCSAGFVYRVFRLLGIQSKTKHKEHHRQRKVKDKYPNLIFSTWETVDRPRQVIVSDMTAFHIWIRYVEVTFYFDVFTKQILSWRIGALEGDRNQYIEGMKDMVRGCIPNFV